MRNHIEGFRGPLAAEQFVGGQSNPTYKLLSGAGSYVLRRKPLGRLLPSAHMVDREYRVMHALSGTGVPVPKAYALCEDDAVIGSAFFVMGFLDGRIFWDPRLPGLAAAERRAMFASMNTVIAALHSVDYVAVGLGEFGRPGNYLARQVARWSRQYQASQTEPRVIGVLDWELSTIGDPLADFAYHCLTWRVTPALFRGLAGIDFSALGIPDEPAYVASYCRRTGRDGVAAWEFYMVYSLFRIAAIVQGIAKRAIEGWEFYLVYSLFRIAAILQGIAKRAIDGTAASADAAEQGRLARPLAEQAWELAQSLG